LWRPERAHRAFFVRSLVATVEIIVECLARQSRPRQTTFGIKVVYPTRIRLVLGEMRLDLPMVCMKSKNEALTLLLIHPLLSRESQVRNGWIASAPVTIALAVSRLGSAAYN
jgi:hypothetical protein